MNCSFCAAAVAVAAASARAAAARVVRFIVYILLLVYFCLEQSGEDELLPSLGCRAGRKGQSACCNRKNHPVHEGLLLRKLRPV
jgi:hypothetical protein